MCAFYQEYLIVSFASNKGSRYSIRNDETTIVNYVVERKRDSWGERTKKREKQSERVEEGEVLGVDEREAGTVAAKQQSHGTHNPGTGGDKAGSIIR